MTIIFGIGYCLGGTFLVPCCVVTMSISKSLLFVLTLIASVAMADEPASVAPAAGAALSTAVTSSVSLQAPQEREWYRTAVLFLGIAAVSATFLHGLSSKRNAT